MNTKPKHITVKALRTVFESPGEEKIQGKTDIKLEAKVQWLFLHKIIKPIPGKYLPPLI